MLFKTCRSQDSKEYKISEIRYPMLVLETYTIYVAI